MQVSERAAKVAPGVRVSDLLCLPDTVTDPMNRLAASTMLIVYLTGQPCRTLEQGTQAEGAPSGES